MHIFSENEEKIEKENIGMLRITETPKDEKTVILRLDGKVVGTCVTDLERICMYYSKERTKTVVLDF
ncbi:MAG: hypothetical protein ACREA4_11610, partial [Nitrososphaera sp.]